MRIFTFFACLLASVMAFAQFSGPGYYRVHNVGSDGYITIRGTHFEKELTADAFWPCVLMQKDSAAYCDPGAIIYIPGTDQVSLYSQGVDTYSLTGLLLDIEPSPVMENGLDTYCAHVQYESYNCFFRDSGNGMKAGGSNRKAESHWWIEPVNEASMDTSYLGLKPFTSEVADADGWYWATMCCDYPVLIPKEGGVEGAYTIKEVAMGPDSLYYAQPVKVYGQGEIVPAATPVLYKCASPYASGNKVVPVGEIARHTDLPISSNLLMGSYFSSFTNYADLSDHTVKAVYIPEQAIPATPEYLALAADSCGKMTFIPKDAETYMDANSAWLNIQGLELDPETEIIFGMMPVVEPVVVPDPEPKDGSGDANGDTKVDVDDLTLVISFVLGDSALETKSKTVYVNACDVDMNGIVDVDDVTALIHMLLNSHDDSDNGSGVE